MSNMSYCRFENTVADLKDCYAHITDNDLSEDEWGYRKRLIQTCVDIALECGHEVGQEVQEVEEGDDDDL
jgi:hypothetical protein